ncbi:MAG: alkaline phosphatase family protein [Solobacterium sp.]|jgi:predicted AlkP superfamily pyrophosphatase or phosphodiesterase|nr:alkaline phosphatase family protein [Solobacterium sp.]MCH4206573.1 alkaline phosphatase family protein [Solobacterium sp.]MCH4228019.1 alkaline phosphatase family protein [Solobacterium sp.]MCH4283438.1 alkaline phosphatase family protein [Solobacterium sp.]
MQKVNVPDYDNSILSVSASVLKHYGIDCGHPSQPLADEALAGDPRTAVIMLFDGMGVNLLEKHLPEDSFLRRNMKGTISSVFPPTTVAATTSIQSGLAPIEHGWLGWTLYFKEVKDNVAVFSNHLVSTGKPASKESLAETYLPYENICEQIHKSHPEVDAQRPSLNHRPYIFSIGSACRKVLHISRRPGKHFVYCYWINPDHLIHKYGVNSPEVHKTILKINEQTEKMCAKLKDTSVIMLADHGLIDTEWKCMADVPGLCEMLIRRPSIESRANSFFVKPECMEDFKALFEKNFGDDFALLSREEVKDISLFGKGRENPRINEFVGDYLAVATGKYSLCYDRPVPKMIGIHAGDTKEELTVPLIIINR